MKNIINITRKVVSVFAAILSIILFYLWACSFLYTEWNGRFDNYDFTSSSFQNYAISSVIHEDGQDATASMEEFDAYNYRRVMPGESFGWMGIMWYQFLQPIIWIILNILIVGFIVAPFNAEKENFSTLQFSGILLTPMILLTWNIFIIYFLWTASGGDLFNISKYV